MGDYDYAGTRIFRQGERARCNLACVRREAQLRDQTVACYYAHSAGGESGEWQGLARHLHNVAELAARFAAPYGAEREAEIAGLVHDLGKYSDRFQARLRDPRIHGINHWTAGASEAAAIRAPLVDYAVEGHHTGLPTFGDLRQAINDMGDAGRRQSRTGCAEPLATLLGRFAEDGLGLPPAPPRPEGDHFALAMRARFIFSALVDGDFLDTEAHFAPADAAQRSAQELEAGRGLEALQAYLASLRAEGDVGTLRRHLLGDCLRAAERPPGLFTLTAPTGSGKTLASMAFALRHIVVRNGQLRPEDPRRLRRVIVVIPYTSIVEQTAGVYRELFAPVFGRDCVLEHHCAVTPTDFGTGDDDAEGGRQRRARLAAENWSAPIIVTTDVQFFESLFAHRPAACRKLHNIARSVLIFDEVQTLPPGLVPSLLSAVRLLAREPYGASAVFMTATLPAFEAASASLPYGWQPVPIESDGAAMAAAMRRTAVTLPAPGEWITWAALAERLRGYEQALCVVNTTADARELFRLLRVQGCFHLSSRLCPAHRREKLGAVRALLAGGKPCRLVSTQLVEAGVDVDFPVAFRAMGPLDSIIQTAGRCNREGRSLEPGPVIVFRPERGGMPRGAYRTAAELSASFLDRHPGAADRLHDPSMYREYFAELYPLLGRDRAEDDAVFKASGEFNFPAAAASCRLVPDDTRPVLVQWREGHDLIAKLRREKHLSPSQWRAAQSFSVNLHLGEFGAAEASGYVAEAADDVWYWNSHYDDELGACHPEGADLCL